MRRGGWTLVSVLIGVGWIAQKFGGWGLVALGLLVFVIAATPAILVQRQRTARRRRIEDANAAVPLVGARTEETQAAASKRPGSEAPPQPEFEAEWQRAMRLEGARRHLVFQLYEAMTLQQWDRVEATVRIGGQDPYAEFGMAQEFVQPPTAKSPYAVAQALELAEVLRFFDDWKRDPESARLRSTR